VKLLTVNMTLDLETGGGSAARTTEFTRALVHLGQHCRIATTGRLSTSDLAAATGGAEVIALSAIGVRFRMPYAGFAALDRVVRDSDVVLIMNHWTAINVVAWRDAVRAGVPYVVCPAGALPIGGRSVWLKRQYNARYGLRLIRDAAAWVAVTADEIAQFAEYGVAADRVVVVPNGMPTLPAGNAAAFRRRLGVEPTVPIALFLGRLAPIKGPDLLIDAFARSAPALPAWHLVIAGPDDGMLAALRRQADGSSVARRIHFTGFLDPPSKADALAAADLVVVPSRREAMSIVVLEAAAAGRAVLITDRCGLGEVAAAGGGWVVEASSAGLAAGLGGAAADREQLRAMGLRWQRYAGEHFSWDRVARRLADVLTEAAAGRRR
jgi:glycosyltransferase involved in cell wall biosynthesis